MVLGSITVASMKYNAKAVMERKAGAIFPRAQNEGKCSRGSEREVQKGWLDDAMRTLRRVHKKAKCRSRSRSKGTDNIVVVQAKRKTENFQNAWLAGRVDKYEVDLGWEANLTAYVLYGKSGGSAKDKATTEETLEAIRVEIASEYQKPTIII